MKQKLINSQLSNFRTYEMYKRQLITLAENVFEFKNLPEFIDTSFMNRQLLRNGGIAFFKDEAISDEPLCLPYVTIGRLDVYGRPLKIQVMSNNGYTRILNKDEFIIMYDNNGRYPMWLDILQYAERIALATRVIDINLRTTKDPSFLENKNRQRKNYKRLS